MSFKIKEDLLRSSFIFFLDSVATTEEHLQAFRRGAHFSAILEAIRGFMPEIVEMRH